jgi:cobalt-zinc-cadmium efflux system outer membrane protein
MDPALTKRFAAAALALITPLAVPGRASAQAVAVPAVAAAAPLDATPSLERVVSLARELAPAVAVARAELGIGRSAYVGARLGPVANPYLEVLADRGTAGATKDVTIQGQLFVPIEVGGQRGLRVTEVDALVAWQEAGVDASRAAAAGDAVRAYGALVVAAARVRAFAGLAGVSRDEAAVYDARLAAGDATEQDAKLARVELARNSIVVAESRADLARAIADLHRLIGARVAEPTGVAAEPPPPKIADAVAAAASSPHVLEKAREAAYHARAKDRQGREALSPLNVIVTAGRGDLGEARFGGGLGWALPFARRNQGEQARAEAERARATIERDVRSRVIAATIDGLTAERREVRRALAELADSAEPAARASVEAAAATQRAGKGELLKVLLARRDLALLEARRLDLLQREWSLLADLVTLTGDLP